MSFFAIVIALLLEQVRPLLPGNLAHAGFRAWSVSVRRSLDAGRPLHGWLAWGAAVGLPAALVLAVYWLLDEMAWPLGLVWSIAMLYITLGFRQFSHHFTRIRDALCEGDEEAARRELAAWQRMDTRDMPRGLLLRHVLHHSLLAAHRHVFGVLLCFVLLAALGLGPLGAVLYRMAAHVQRAWSAPEFAGSPLHRAALEAWHWINWLPARLTALSFAVVGNFEDAVENWRFAAPRFAREARGDGGDGADGIILAAAAGAMGVRLDDPGDDEEDDDEGSAGEAGMDDSEPDVEHLRSVVGLVWRAVVLWMLLLALLTMAAHLPG